MIGLGLKIWVLQKMPHKPISLSTTYFHTENTTRNVLLIGFIPSYNATQFIRLLGSIAFPLLVTLLIITPFLKGDPTPMLASGPQSTISLVDPYS